MRIESQSSVGDVLSLLILKEKAPPNSDVDSYRESSGASTVNLVVFMGVVISGGISSSSKHLGLMYPVRYHLSGADFGLSLSIS